MLFLFFTATLFIVEPLPHLGYGKNVGGYQDLLCHFFGLLWKYISVTRTTGNDETIRSMASFLFQAGGDGHYTQGHDCCFSMQYHEQLPTPQWLQIVAVGPIRTSGLVKRQSRYHPKSLNLKLVRHWLRHFISRKA